MRQIEENLGAVDVQLPDKAVARLSSAVQFSAGFPADLSADRVWRL